MTDLNRKSFFIKFYVTVTDIAMPDIGAGLGKLNWEYIKEYIFEVAADYPNVKLHIVEKYKP